MNRYFITHETGLLRFESSRLGDVVMTRKADGRQVYFQPGDAGSEILSILEESPPDAAVHMHFDEYFAA